MKNILEYLKKSAGNFSDRVFIGESDSKTTYGEFLSRVRSTGSALLKHDVFKKPVAVLTGKNAKCLTLAFGTVAAGGFYTILDNKSPSDRLSKIISSLCAEIILTDRENEEKAKEIFSGTVLLYEDIAFTPENEEGLRSVREKQTDSDILYVLFTSGSTGTPKGAVLTHRAVISYIGWVTKEFDFDENTVFGSQSPFYFSMSVTDVFSALSSGARLEIIPKEKFAFPVELINYLNEKKVNTIYWVPTALSIVANLKTFECVKPESLKTVLFAGEVMPAKQLNYWIAALPEATVFANLFGPTETTDICTFYVINRTFRNDESIPIGSACDNCRIYIIDETGKEAEQGEMYAGGSFLASGYYNEKEKTASAFVQNPLQSAYPEILYRTGDIVKKNSYGEIEFVSRVDFQIKHSGYRIELGEIETILNACESVKSAVCVYDGDRDLLVLVFEGKKSAEQLLRDTAGEKLVSYMRPNVYMRISQMPQNANGKTDRRAILEYYKNNIERGI